jgi:glycosyltransferase domain-containing protein
VNPFRFGRKLGEIAQSFRPKAKPAMPVQDLAAARLELSNAPDLVELAGVTDALLSLEVRSGCFGEVEALLAKASAAIFANKVSYASEQAHAVERIWINLLRLGLFDELRHVIDQHALPVQADVKTFIDYCALQYVACRKRGQAYRAAHPAGDIFGMGCIVWGETYIRNFLRYNLRSMLSPGNLPALRRQGRVVFSIVTNAAGERQMRDDAIFAQVGALADIEFVVVPDEVIGTLLSGHLVRNFYILYGMLDHCSIFFALGASSHLFMIPVDAVVAEGSLANMADYRHQGYECCGAGNIVANIETFLPAIEEMYPGDGPIAIATAELASLAVEHAHHYFLSQIVAVENVDFGKHPRELFWPRADGVEIHSVFIHPLFTTSRALANYRRMHFANIDYGMIPRMFAGSARIKIIEDPREAYVNNFTAKDRLYETTGQPFAIADFLRCHDWTYPVQKSLFNRGQVLPCRLPGWTAYRDIGSDVREIVQRFRDERVGPPAQGTVRQTDLTIILPTRNRPELCRAQIRFLQGCSLAHRVIVADSSDLPDPQLQRACTGVVEYRRFDPATSLESKFVAAARLLDTPFVAMITDDDVSFPHAIEACLAHLRQHGDCVSAQGYVLDASIAEDRVDVHGVRWMGEGIVEPTALGRLYELMRRYQPFFWAVFRTPAYLRAMEASSRAQGAFFRELIFTATIALLGKSARLPLVQTLRSNDDSLVPAREGHPFHWFLHDAQSFFESYASYRAQLLGLLTEIEGTPPAAAGRARRLLARWPARRRGSAPEALRQTLDLIHAAYFGREVDTGIVNHSARLALGEALPPVKPGRPSAELPGPGDGDLVHLSAVPGRSYLWREAVMKVAPDAVGEHEMARVEAQLDEYLTPAALAPDSSSVHLDAQLVAARVAQSTTLENAVLQTVDDTVRLTERPRPGLHRLLLRVDDCANGTVEASFLAKPAGCSLVRVELHDDGAKHYVASDVDLASGQVVALQGDPVRCRPAAAGPPGYFELSASIRSAAPTAAHLTVSLLDPEHAISYAGREGKGVLLGRFRIG